MESKIPISIGVLMTHGCLFVFIWRLGRGDLVMASFELSLIKLNEWFDP